MFPAISITLENIKNPMKYLAKLLLGMSCVFIEVTLIVYSGSLKKCGLLSESNVSKSLTRAE